MTRRRTRVSVALVLAVIVAVIVAVMVRGGRPPAATPAPAVAPTPTAALQELSPTEAGRAFLGAYVSAEGRVVRYDQGGDTVSEGQAYAMLVAAGIGDRTTFASVWSWTRQHLLRPDGTLSWHWRDGQVADASSASDADLDTARALIVAGGAFGDPQYTTDGIALGRAILATETVQTTLGRILVAGDWATTEPYAYNPSYPSPVAFEMLTKADPDPRWAELMTGSRAVTAKLLDSVDLPPDWAEVHTDGRVVPTAGPAEQDADKPRFGYDAARLPLRFAESCHPEDVALAARLAEPLARSADHPAVRSLDGVAMATHPSVVAIAAQAAVSAASAHPEDAAAELTSSDYLQQQQPTYYGGAWNALGRLLVTDGALGGCPPMPR